MNTTEGIDVGEVAMVDLATIEVGERARQEMGDLNDLECSLKESGLISPLTVKRKENGKYFLLAGERRFITLRKNCVAVVPVRIYDRELTPIEIKTIEMSENFYRKDMEYWEYDNIVKDIHELKVQVHGVRPPGPGDEGWSVENTADMVGLKSKASVSTAIKRAETREAFPELFEKCKTQQDASKIIKKMDEAVVKSVIAQKIESSPSDTNLTKLSNSFQVGNVFEGIKKIPDGVMHLVEIDPPYSIGLKEAKKREGESMYALGDYNEVPASDYMDGGDSPTWLGMNTLFKECYRVMTEHAWLLCWFGPEPWFGDIYNALNNAGFETTRMCPIWTKPGGQTKRPEIHLPNSYEMFFYAWKGRPAIAKVRGGNEFEYSPVPANQKTHPTERPIDLMRDIYETFAFPGSRIMIPFLGSGSGLLAAHSLGMTGLGWELSKAYRDSFLVRVHGMS